MKQQHQPVLLFLIDNRYGAIYNINEWGAVMNRVICCALCALISFCCFGCGSDSAAQPSTAAFTEADVYQTLPDAEFIYNTNVNETYISYTLPQGMFEEELDSEEIAALIPDDRFACTGTGAWDAEGKLLWVDLDVAYGGNPVSVYFPVSFGLSSPQISCTDPKYTQCNGISFEVVEFPYGKNVTWLRATCLMGSQYVSIDEFCSDETLDERRQDYETVVRWMSLLASNLPDFSALRYSQIPEYIHTDLTEAEACEDESFGHILSSVMPAGFSEGYFTRCKDYRQNYLYAEFSKGEGNVGFTLEYFTKEHEEALITEGDFVAAAKELYDPIFELKDATVAVIEARKNRVASTADTHLLVKWGEYLIGVVSDGISAEELFEILHRLQN